MFNLNLKNDAFGLDISDLSLKIIKLKPQSKNFLLKKKKNNLFFDLSSFGKTAVGPGVIKKGEVRKPDELIEAIKKAISQVHGDKLTVKNAVVSLPEEKSFLQIIKMPNLSKEELRSAVIFEAENHIPLPIEEVYLDYQVVSRPGLSGNIDVLVVAFPKKIIDSYIDCLERAGVRPIVLETESLAVSRALIKGQFTDKPVLLIDFGANRTVFVVYEGNSVKFTFSIPVSSHGFSDALAREMKISFEEAEELKIKHGLSDKIKLQIKDDKSIKKVEKGEFFETLIPALTDLIEQIKKYIYYYETHFISGDEEKKFSKIEKILICGGGAKLKGLTSFLSSELNIPVEIGNPWTNVLPDFAQPKEQILIYQKEESLSYATALGLALRGFL